MPLMIFLVIRSAWKWLIQYEQGHIFYFFEKVHFRDSRIDDISGLGLELKSRRDTGVAISSHEQGVSNRQSQIRRPVEGVVKCVYAFLVSDINMGQAIPY